MAIPTGRPITEYMKIAVAALVGSVLLALVGWIPTSRIAGDAAVEGMIAGIGISLVASLVAAAPIAFTRKQAPGGRLNIMLGATALRMFVTMGLFVVVVFAAWFPRNPTALWTGLSYLCLLAIETCVFVRLVRGRATENSR